jgi:hypothetical protein
VTPSRAQVGSYNRHYRVQHMDLRYECTQCDAAFGRPDHLAQHERRHAAPVRFACAVPGCAMDYSDARGLRRHMAGAHAAQPPPPARCELCGRLYASAASVLRHRRLHHQADDPVLATAQAAAAAAAAAGGDLSGAYYGFADGGEAGGDTTDADALEA